MDEQPPAAPPAAADTTPAVASTQDEPFAPAPVAAEATPAVASIQEEAAAEMPAPAIVPAVPRPAYEHPWAVRFCHWVNAVAVTVLAMSGLQILYAFPSFGPKIPQSNVVDRIPAAIRLGGWLGGALQWHLTFMWIFAATAALYVVSQIVSGHYRTVLFTPRDVPGVWPMARHYFLFAPQPPATGQYNALQKLAYTSTIGFGALSLATGMVMYKPAQLSAVGWILGGYHTARLLHFIALCGFVAFVPGHLVMVALHGWDNFASMLTGWKRRPEYAATEDR